MPKSAANNSSQHKFGRALILSTRRGKVQFADRTARRWLKQLFGKRGTGPQLPAELRRWLSTSASKPIALPLGGKYRNARLYVKKKSLTKQSVVLAFEFVKGNSLKETARRQRGLTAREWEVLFWLARGKTNADIAAILGVAPATVGKHLERIYPKLGVENRTAASTFARSE